MIARLAVFDAVQAGFGRVDLALWHYKAVADRRQQHLGLVELEQLEDAAPRNRLGAAALVQPHQPREQPEQLQALEHQSERAAAHELDQPRVRRQPAILTRLLDLRARCLQNLAVLHTTWADRLAGAAVQAGAHLLLKDLAL